MDLQHMHDSQSLIEELQGILLAEIEAYQHLVELQQAEKRLLVTRALDLFLTTLQAKEHRLRTIAQLEQKRQTVLESLAPLLHLPDANVTLQHLSTLLPEPVASILLAYRARLQQLLAELQQGNRENMRLLQDSQALIDETLAFFTSLVPTRPTYQRSGTFVPPAQGRLLSGRV
jgi:hypothetical protein